MGGIKGRIKKICLYIEKYMPQAGRLKGLFLFLDTIWATLIYGGSIDDYFYYKFYERRHAARKNFNVWRKRKRIINICNDKEDREVFDDKSLFNKVFADFVARDWLNMTECSYQEFVDFTSRNNPFFVKPVSGSFGFGTRVIRVSCKEDFPALYAELREEKALVEEVIKQREEVAAFNQDSVNTLRIMTLLLADGSVKVMTASMRYGRGCVCADNLALGGIASVIDVETGIVATTGVDINSKRYVLHPRTAEPIVGFQVPCWKEVLATVKAAAKVVPTVRYVGWDVALGMEDRIIIVEGNSAADADLTEIPDQVGKWPLYKEEVKKIARLNTSNRRREKRRDIDGKNEPALF